MISYYKMVNTILQKYWKIASAALSYDTG